MSHQDDVFVATFKGVLAFLVVLTVVLIILANFIVGYNSDSASVTAGATKKNIAPVGRVKVAGSTPAVVSTPVAAPAAPVAAADPADGKEVYTMACLACHDTGVAGAPRIGDQAAWGPRIAQGSATLNEHAIQGFQGSKGFMPAKGGRADLSDDAIIAAVTYLVSQSK